MLMWIGDAELRRKNSSLHGLTKSSTASEHKWTGTLSRYARLSGLVERISHNYTKQYLLVVGGFGDSPYLRRRLKQEAATRGVEVTLANDSA